MCPRENLENLNNTDSSSKCKTTIDLVFKVWAPKLNHMAHRLYLLGSLKQMGAWNIQAAAQAFSTTEFHTWRVDIREIPINSSFEWSWVKANANKTDIKWERMTKRNRTVDCFGGVIHTIYGDGEEVFVQSATYAEVSTYRKVDKGLSMVLTGCSQTTGAWDIRRATRATEYPRQSGYWKVQVAFDSNSTLAFKWAIVNDSDRKLHLMERENHVLYGRQTWVRAVAPWNVPRVYIEDTPVCLEPLDHVMGRTDVLVNAKKAHTESIRKWLKADPKRKTPALVPISNVPTHRSVPITKNVPTTTDVEKARQALRKYMTLPEQEPDKKSNRVSIVMKKHGSVDEHVKKTRPESAKKSKQLENEGKTFNSAMLIKGKGQTELNPTSSQGCDGDSSITSLENGSKPAGIVESEKTCSFADPLRCGVEAEESCALGDTLNLENLKLKDEKPFCQEDDSGFDTASQRSAFMDTVSDNTTTIMDKWDTETQASCSPLQEENLKPIIVEENVADDYFSAFHNAIDAYNLEFKKPVQSTGGEELYFPMPSKEESGYFEEDEYLDFLCSRVSEEESLTASFKIRKNTEIEYVLSDATSTPKTFFNQDHRKINGEKSNRKKSKQPSINAKQYSCDSKDDVTTCTYDTGDFNELVDDLDSQETAKKRIIARLLERHWGESGDCNKSEKSEQGRKKKTAFLERVATLSSLLTSVNPRPSTVSYKPGVGGVADLMPPLTQRMPVALYSNTELANATIPPPDNVDHRAVARQMEEFWGKNSHIMLTT